MLIKSKQKSEFIFYLVFWCLLLIGFIKVYGLWSVLISILPLLAIIINYYLFENKVEINAFRITISKNFLWIHQTKEYDLREIKRIYLITPAKTRGIEMVFVNQEIVKVLLWVKKSELLDFGKELDKQGIKDVLIKGYIRTTKL